MNILVLTDFSKPSEAGINLALGLVKSHGASVTIFHCLTEETSVDFQLGPNHKFKLVDSTNPDASDWISRWNKKAKILNHNIQFIISGGILEEIVDSYCINNKVDFIIMGSSGKNQSTTWGSNTENIVRHIHQPILVVKEKPSSSNFQKIVFAAGFTENEKKSFLMFKDIFPIPDDAEIHLLCIDKESFFSQPTPLIKEVMSDFEQLAKPYKSYRHFYQDYNVKAGIKNFTEDLAPDLIVMSNNLKKTIKHLFFGNDAVNVAFESKYPVLIINHPE